MFFTARSWFQVSLVRVDKLKCFVAFVLLCISTHFYEFDCLSEECMEELKELE